MDGSIVFVIILLAMTFGFLALRLYSVLGKRTGHEQQPLPRPAEERSAPLAQPHPIDVVPQPRDAGPRGFEPSAERGIRAIVAAEPNFDVAQFVEGAKSAYRMILEAYWAGDRETLGWLAEDEVKTAFEAAIDEREAAGHTLDNRLITIERALISDARVEGNVASISVRFDADIAAVTRNADGEVIAGSLSDAVQTNDVWTFSRKLRSGDPNWKLSDTDEA